MKDLDEIEMLIDTDESIREMIEEGVIEFYDYLHQRRVIGKLYESLDDSD